MSNTCCFQNEGGSPVGVAGGFLDRLNNSLRYGPAARIFNAGRRLIPSLALAVSLGLASSLASAGTARAETVLLGLGDSLMAGYGLPAEESFTAQLEAALKAKGHDVRVANAGVSGDTTAGGLARLDWALAEKPDAAIVELGANDGMRGLAPEQLYSNLDAILTRFEKEGVPVLLAGMLAPPNYGKEYGDAFKAAYDRLSEKHDVVFYPFFLEGVAAEKLMNQGDGIHPNKEGVAIIVERILPKVEELLGKVDG